MSKKSLFRNRIHIREKSHDCSVHLMYDRKVKFTYEAYNAQERYTVELFDGHKWNFLMGMDDMGVIKNCSIYIHDESKRLARCNELFNIAEQLVSLILK